MRFFWLSFPHKEIFGSNLYYWDFEGNLNIASFVYLRDLILKRQRGDITGKNRFIVTL